LRAHGGAVERRGSVGLVAHHSMLYDALTARENLQFFARLHGADSTRRADELLDRMGLSAWADERVAAFSRGMTQRLAIARALLHEPAILLLDEPLTGLDDRSSEKVLDVLAELKQRGRALLVASHQLAELMSVVTAVGFLIQGTLRAVEPLGGRDAGQLAGRYQELTARA
jgi:ABC-type multidrug transport system ATPase subunit